MIFALFNLYRGATGLHDAYGGNAHSSSFNYMAASDTERREFLEHVATSIADAMRPTKLGTEGDLLKTHSVTGAYDHDTRTIQIVQIVEADLLTIEGRRLLENTIFEQNCRMVVNSSLSQLGLSIEFDAKNKSGQQFYFVMLSQKTCAPYEANAQIRLCG